MIQHIVLVGLSLSRDISQINTAMVREIIKIDFYIYACTIYFQVGPYNKLAGTYKENLANHRKYTACSF